MLMNAIYGNPFVGPTPFDKTINMVSVTVPTAVSVRCRKPQTRHLRRARPVRPDLQLRSLRLSPHTDRGRPDYDSVPQPEPLGLALHRQPSTEQHEPLGNRTAVRLVPDLIASQPNSCKSPAQPSLPR